MFSEGFHFKKTAWHAKLMRYTWGFRPQDFSHMCPYFWLSVFNVVIAPAFIPLKFTIKTIIFKWLFKGIFYSFKWLFKKLEQFITYLSDLSQEWAAASQKKYEEEEYERIRKIKESALEKIRKIPEKYRQIILRGDAFNYYDVRNFIPDDIKGKFRKKAWLKWYRAFIKFHSIDEESSKTIILKAKEIDLEELKKKQDLAKTKEAEEAKGHAAKYENARATWAAKLDSEEEKQKKLQREAAKLEQEELRKAAKELKEREDAEKKRLRDIAKKEKIIKNKQKINKILKIAKPIAKVFIWVIGGIVAIFGLYFIYLLFILVFKFFGNVQHETYTTIGSWIFWGLAVIVGGVITYILTMFIVKLVGKINVPDIAFKTPKIPLPVIDWEKVSKPFGSLLEKIFDILIYIWKILIKGFEGLSWPFIQFWRGIVTLGKIIKQTYKNECPPIYWDDDKN